ncbi:MAG: hemerythrin domain-containing protein [Chloroflexi bacterium]|nr:hemerythrin domain-containing protein [Chloroflexota bacterium]
MAKLDPIVELKADHKKVRDSLLDLIDATGRADVAKSLEILIYLDKLTGPHFRFEEETLYPTLAKFFGEEYHQHLLTAHDRIIRTAKELAGILGKGEITPEEADKLPGVIRTQVLPHPIECEGVALFAERLTEGEVDAIGRNLEDSRKADIPLLEWSDTIRARKA